jgi:hypothetical protein
MKELDELSPFLANLKTEIPPPKVPEGYFDTLATQIFERTIFLETPTLQKEVKKGFWEQLANRFMEKPLWGVATFSFIFIVVFGIYFSQSETKTLAADLTATEIASYVEANIQDFDTEYFASVMTNATFDASQMPELQQEGLENFVEEEVLETVDLNTLEDLF